MITVNELKKNNRRYVAIWGYPNPDVLYEMKIKYPNHEFIDIDVNYKAVSCAILPDAYCKIIRNIIDNAIALKDKIDLIIASTGEEKCDAGRFAYKILQDLGFNIISTIYTEYNNTNRDLIISQSALPLKDKIIMIMDNILLQEKFELPKSEAKFGFWGVPPNDLSILELFPNETHVFGWVRCVEAQRPADLDIELYVNPDVPTVFFAQTFCAKMQLAKYLADKYNGLYVDVDDIASNSVKAKIEAFLRLR